MTDLHKTHELTKETRTITQRRCWSVVFNCNGNAPADATAASFATKELAEEARALWAAMKDDDKVPVITLNGVRHWGLMNYEVEGFNFDTSYEVKEDWQADANILTSLDQLVALCDYQSPTDQQDCVELLDEEPGDDEEDD